MYMYICFVVHAFVTRTDSDYQCTLVASKHNTTAFWINSCVRETHRTLFTLQNVWPYAQDNILRGLIYTSANMALCGTLTGLMLQIWLFGLSALLNFRATRFLKSLRSPAALFSRQGLFPNWDQAWPPLPNSASWQFWVSRQSFLQSFSLFMPLYFVMSLPG